MENFENADPSSILDNQIELGKEVYSIHPVIFPVEMAIELYGQLLGTQLAFHVEQENIRSAGNPSLPVQKIKSAIEHDRPWELRDPCTFIIDSTHLSKYRPIQ